MKPYCCALTIDSEILTETRLGRGLSEKKNLSKAMLPHWQSVKYEITSLPLARVFVFQIFSRVETILESGLR